MISRTAGSRHRVEAGGELGKKTFKGFRMQSEKELANNMRPAGFVARAVQDSQCNDGWGEGALEKLVTSTEE
jgi:hypothetical protein